VGGNPLLRHCAQVNSAGAYFKAAQLIEQGAKPVPVHLMDASRDAKGFGHGQGASTRTAFRALGAQQYLPDEVKEQKFYEPSEEGREKR
jgi:putative ATPase